MKNINSNLNTLKQYRLPGALLLFCMCLLSIRMKLTHSLFLAFLIWNLFLAFTPLIISRYLLAKQDTTGKYTFLLLFIIWILLLPNAPYLITDFIHLYKNNTVPIWFDILLIASFSIVAMLSGLQSMLDVYTILFNKINKLYCKAAIGFVCILCGFGIYLGRFLRYNSWDVLHKPFSILQHSFTSLFSDETYKSAWGVTLGFGILQYLMFSIYRNLKKFIITL